MRPRELLFNLLARANSLPWFAFIACLCTINVRDAIGQWEAAREQFATDDESQAVQVRFDFPWTLRLHRFFDLQLAQDQAGARRELAVWSKSKDRMTATHVYEANALIKLLEPQLEASFNLKAALERKIAKESVPFSLLCAYEQICVRLPTETQELRPAIEARLASRTADLVASYSRGSYSKDDFAQLVASAIARLKDDVLAAQLLQKSLAAQTARAHEFEFPLVSAYAERLCKLARDPSNIDNAKVRQAAIMATKRLCKHLRDVPDDAAGHPLALGKAHDTLAALYALEPSGQRDGFENLFLARQSLDECERRTFELEDIPLRWQWESQRMWSDSSDATTEQMAQRLLLYRLEKMRASVLLASYNLQKRFTSDNRQVTLAEIESSLGKLRTFQKSFKISNEERLSTMTSLAVVLREQRSASFEEVLNDAMQLAWSMPVSESRSVPLRQLILETQLMWIEVRVQKASEKSPANLPALEDVIARLSLQIDKNAEFQPLRLRLQLADMTHRLASENFEWIVRFIQEVESQQSSDQEVKFLTSFLSLLLAKQSGDLGSAISIAKNELSDSNARTSKQKLMRFYALAELELAGMQIESPDSPPQPVWALELFDMLEEQAPDEMLSAALLDRLKVENAYQIASMASRENSADFRIVLNDLQREKLTEVLESVASKCEVQDALAYRRIWHHQANTRDNVGADYPQMRARLALAMDQFEQGFKQIVAAREAKQTQAAAACRLKADEIGRQEREANSLQQKMLWNYNQWILQSTAQQKLQTKSNIEGQEREHEKLAKLIKASRVDLQQSYDQLFRISADQDTFTTPIDYLPQIHAFVKQSGVSSKNPNLFYNARCLLLSVATVRPDLLPDVEPNELDSYATEVCKSALAMRMRWRNTIEYDHSSAADQGDPLQAARNRIFDRYQLGFETAIGWTVARSNFASRRKHTSVAPDLQKAIKFAATTTNRSFEDFRQNADAPAAKITSATADAGRSENTKSSVRESSRPNIERPDVELPDIELPERFIAYYCGNSSLHVFWRLKGQIKHAESLVNRKVLDQTVRMVLQLYRTRDFDNWQHAVESRLLSGWLLPRELCQELSQSGSHECIYVAPHGPLFSIPLEALEVLQSTPTTQTLGALHPLIYLPTLSQGQPESAQPRPTSPNVLVVKLDVEGSEVIRMQEKFQNRVTYVPPDECTKNVVLDKLFDPVGWEIVHIAAHGERATSTSDALVQLKGESLYASDLRLKYQKSPLKARHVFLGVCETQVVNPDDLKTGGNTLGALGTSFLAVGAEDVIATHWQVSDSASAQLFKKLISLYQSRPENSEGVSTEQLATMLFTSRQTVRANTSHPYYWSGFTLWASHAARP